ncbi:MAG: tetratricopeptide repeat protein [Candidatus Pacebacteria bacterium]|nr:tetratricopeptide repeat protein [Candidatus Paceibacterota bacterium]
MMEFLILILILILGYIFIKEYKNFSKLNLEKSKKYLKSGKADQAEKILYFLIKRNKEGSVEAMNELGKLYFSQGKNIEARILFENVYNSKIQNSNFILIALKNLVLIAESEGNYDLAIEYILKFNEIKKKYINLKSNKVDDLVVNFSRCFLKIGKSKKAIRLVEENLKDNSSDVNKAKTIKQLGEIFLELGRYKEAGDCFLKKELFVLEDQKREIKYFLMMSLVGLKDYDKIFKLSSEKGFFQGNKKESLILGLYASAIANLKKDNKDEARKKFDKIFNIIISSLNINEFYKFYYYSCLLYYGLGKLEIKEKKYEEAEKYFQKTIEILEVIPQNRYKYFTERTNLNFFKLLSYYELIIIGNDKEEKINEALLLINSLTKKEKEYIEIKEIGNEGSIIKKINSLKKR